MLRIARGRVVCAAPAGRPASVARLHFRAMFFLHHSAVALSPRCDAGLDMNSWIDMHSNALTKSARLLRRRSRQLSVTQTIRSPRVRVTATKAILRSSASDSSSDHRRTPLFFTWFRGNEHRQVMRLPFHSMDRLNRSPVTLGNGWPFAD